MLGNLGKGGKAPNLGEMHARAIDASTGATIWDRLLDSVPAPIETFREPVSLVGDELWTAYTLLDFTTPAEACVSLARLDPDDGSVLGSESAFLSGSGLVDAGDAVAQDKVGDCDGGAAVALIVRDRTGAVQWTGTVPEPVHSGSNPAIVDGQIFMTDGSRLFAYPRAGCGAATCDPKLQVDLGASLNGPVGPVAATGGDLVYVTGFDGGIWAVDRSSGAVRWQATTAAISMAVSDGTLYTTSRDPAGGIRLSAYDAEGCGAATCSPRWTSASLPGASVSNSDSSDLALAGGVAYVGAGGGVWAFDAAGCGSAVCDELVVAPVDGVAHKLSVAEGRLFVVADNATTRIATLAAFGPG